MKKIQLRALVLPSFLLICCAVLFSFARSSGGGDHFTIYLNDKLVLKQYLHDVKKVPAIQLLQTSAGDKVEVNYSHCGQTGRNRFITISDDQNRPLKVYQFQDVRGNNSSMSFKLNDISGLEPSKKGKNLQLSYSSKELPKGRLLATMKIENGNLAVR